MTEVLWDGKKCVKFEIHEAGESGEFVWFRAKKDTMYLKGMT